MPTCWHRRTGLLVAGVLLGLLAVPAVSAQERYPPPPPQEEGQLPTAPPTTVTERREVRGEQEAAPAAEASPTEQPGQPPATAPAQPPATAPGEQPTGESRAEGERPGVLPRPDVEERELARTGIDAAIAGLLAALALIAGGAVLYATRGRGGQTGE